MEKPVETSHLRRCENDEKSVLTLWLTSGRGSFEMEFARYDPVPGNIAQKVIADMQKEKEDV